MSALGLLGLTLVVAAGTMSIREIAGLLQQIRIELVSLEDIGDVLSRKFEGGWYEDHFAKAFPGERGEP